MFHLVRQYRKLNMYSNRSGLIVCMCVFHSHILTVMESIFMLYSQ